MDYCEVLELRKIEENVTYEDFLKEFDESGLDPANTVVRCASQTEADIFLEYLCAKGVWDKFQISSISRSWDEFTFSTCYHLSKQSWCDDNWYKEREPHIRIIDFCDIYKESKQNEESKATYISFDELIRGIFADVEQ